MQVMYISKLSEYAEVRRTFDEKGLALEEMYFDASGEPANPARAEFTYTNGKVSETHWFNAEGEEVDKNGNPVQKE